MYMHTCTMYKMKTKNDTKYSSWKIFWKFLDLLLDTLILTF